MSASQFWDLLTIDFIIFGLIAVTSLKSVTPHAINDQHLCCAGTWLSMRGIQMCSGGYRLHSVCHTPLLDVARES